MFLRGCSDHRDQFFCLFELKKIPWDMVGDLDNNVIESSFMH